jgi:hypothetical protein
VAVWISPVVYLPFDIAFAVILLAAMSAFLKVLRRARHRE